MHPGDHKEVIIAVGYGDIKNKQWYAVTNARNPDGSPNDLSAMKFGDAPWFKGTLTIRLISDGAMKEATYSWAEDLESSIFPKLTAIKLPQ